MTVNFVIKDICIIKTEFIQELENEQLKQKLTNAKIALEEVNLNLKNEDFDSDDVIKCIFDSQKNISEAALIISKTETPKKITIEEVEFFIRINIPKFLLTFEMIKIADKDKHVAKISHSQLTTILDQFYTNIPLVIQYIQGKKDELERNKLKPKELNLGKEPLARKLFQILKESKLLLIREGLSDFDDFGICLWMNEKKTIFGFAFGNKLQAKQSVLSVYKFPVGRNLILSNEMKSLFATTKLKEILKDNPLQTKKNYLELKILQTYELVSLLFNHQTEYKLEHIALIPMDSELEVKIGYELEKISDYSGKLKLYPSKKEYIEEISSTRKQTIITSSRKGLSKPELGLIVIDGNNIAHIENNKPKAEKIIKLYDTLRLKYKNVKIKIFFSAKFEHDAEDFAYLTKLISKGIASKTPAKSSDDYYCIKYAINNNGYLMTNDQYNDWKEKYPESKEEIESRRVTVVWDEMTNSYIIGEFPKISQKDEEPEKKPEVKKKKQEEKKKEKTITKLRNIIYQKPVITQMNDQKSIKQIKSSQKYHCEKCNKYFNTQRSLEQHTEARHKKI